MAHRGGRGGYGQFDDYGARDDRNRDDNNIGSKIGDQGYGSRHFYKDRTSEGYGGRDDRDYRNRDDKNIDLFGERDEQKYLVRIPALKKYIYDEDEEVANMSRKDIIRMRKENNIITVSRFFINQESSKDEMPNPIWKFVHCFRAYPEILAELQKEGFLKPTDIQSQAWPILLKGEDLIGVARTNMGKKLAFLLPGIIHAQYHKLHCSEGGGPYMLVLVATRDSALQMDKEVRKYTFGGITGCCVTDHTNREDPIQFMRRGVEILISNPARLMGLIETDTVSLKTIYYVVLADADRMLDMGFESQIRKIMLCTPRMRQTVILCNIWSDGVRSLVRSFTRNPIKLHVSSNEPVKDTVNQLVQLVDNNNKYDELKKFINKILFDDKVIVFCGQRTVVDEVFSRLILDGYLCDWMHEEISYNRRKRVIDDFRSGYNRLVITTDVGYYSLDTIDVTYVVNYDLPQNIDDYQRRLTRTDCMGRIFTAINFFNSDDVGQVKALIKLLTDANEKIPDVFQKMANQLQDIEDQIDASVGSDIESGCGSDVANQRNDSDVNGKIDEHS